MIACNAPKFRSKDAVSSIQGNQRTSIGFMSLLKARPSTALKLYKK